MSAIIDIIVSISCRPYESHHMHVMRGEPYQNRMKILNKDFFLKDNFLNKIILSVQTRYFVKIVLVKLYVTNRSIIDQSRARLFKSRLTLIPD